MANEHSPDTWAMYILNTDDNDNVIEIQGHYFISPTSFVTFRVLRVGDHWVGRVLYKPRLNTVRMKKG